MLILKRPKSILLAFLDITCSAYLIGILILFEKIVLIIANNNTSILQTILQYLKCWSGLEMKWKSFLLFSQNKETGLRSL